MDDLRETPSTLVQIFPGLLRAAHHLRDILKGGKGARIGETGVASTKVHVVDPRFPEEVRILREADAGSVFYHRPHPGQVIHLDVFHETGCVNHLSIARAVAEAVRAFLRDFPSLRGDQAVTWEKRLRDHMDIQTATGGGRVSGALCYGTKASLRAAHKTHVHVALMPPEPFWPLTLYLVDFVEAEILKQGIQIRRIDHIVSISGGRGGADLSSYSSQSDSFIRSENWNQASAFSGGSEDMMRKAVKLADSFDSLTAAAEFLNQFQHWSRLRDLAARGRTLNELAEIADRLSGEGFLDRLEDGYYLTEEGEELRRYVTRHRREVELSLKKKMRRLSVSVQDRINELDQTLPLVEGKAGTRKVALPAEKGRWLQDIAVSETVVAALQRVWAESSPRESLSPFRLTRGDIHVYQKKRYQRVDVCLLIDASASMAGERIRAAKYLAQHLLLSTRDKVAVLTFQERRVELSVPFTRNYRDVELGLYRIRPFGLTPMAEGLVRSLDYIKESPVKNPLLLLITDGIPTVPRGSINPLDDALDAAKVIGRERISFACIGLEPNFEYLNQLVANARGSLYVVDELERETLVAIAHRERARQRERS